MNGLPSRKNEHWKYADLAFLANKEFVPAPCVDADKMSEAIYQHRLQCGDSILLVLLNGRFMASLSDLAKLPQEVIACSLSAARQKHTALCTQHTLLPLDAEKYPFASLNAEMSEDGLFFFVPDHCKIAVPIHLLSILVDASECISHPQRMLVFGEQSVVEIVEEHFSKAEHAYMMNIVTSMAVGTGAQLTYTKIQQEGKQAVHMAYTNISQQQDSHVSLMNFSSGSQFARDDVVFQLQGLGADCQTAGFYHLDTDQQTIDYHIDINHSAPNGHSEMLYKGIVDKKSRAVFNGRVHVEKNAQKISAYQANHHLLLTNEAEAYSKPELEIYADDVQCKHAATTGQIDEEAIFYLRSRGMNYADALGLLLQGFAAEIIERVMHPGIKMRIQEAMQCQ